MPDRRYAQFCPTARAAELLGERWTLLILRELLCGPQRFSDLRRRLPGLGTSVLCERLDRLVERGLLIRRESPPPAPAALYELSPVGERARPLIFELMRFGVNFMDAPRPGDHLEPEWVRLALEAFARRDATPARRFGVRIPNGDSDLRLFVRGGRRGTQVRDGDGDCDASLRAEALTLLGMLSGSLDPEALQAGGQLEVEGDASALRDFPALFDLQILLARPSNPNPG